LKIPVSIAPAAVDFPQLIGAGETVGWAEATAEPLCLTRLLYVQAVHCPPFRVFFPMTFSQGFAAGHPNVTITALGDASAGRRFFAEGADNGYRTGHERGIAEHVARLIPDRATIELGLGAIPETVAHALGGKRGLGVHSGAIGDGIAELMEVGIVVNRHCESASTGDPTPISHRYLVLNLKKTVWSQSAPIGTPSSGKHWLKIKGLFLIRAGSHFGADLQVNPPARIFVNVAAWPGPFDIEIDCIAVRKDSMDAFACVVGIVSHPRDCGVGRRPAQRQSIVKDRTPT
jgi:hypothetical protein